MSASPGPSAASLALDVAVGRLLRAGTVTAVAILAIGVVLMLVHGVSPTDKPFPAFDAGRIPSDILAVRPEGFLWLGLIAVMLTPISRVTASLVGYVRAADRTMVLISIAILAVIAVSVALSVILE
jgi:uncharacterized membrane protein